MIFLEHKLFFWFECLSISKGNGESSNDNKILEDMEKGNLLKYI